MDIEGVKFRLEGGGLWVGNIFTNFGHHEVLLNGTKEGPAPNQIEAFIKFKINIDDNLTQVRKKNNLSFFYRPIRISQNNENRIGIQFKHRLTGKQVGMFFWD